MDGLWIVRRFSRYEPAIVTTRLSEVEAWLQKNGDQCRVYSYCAEGERFDLISDDKGKDFQAGVEQESPDATR